MEESVNIEAQSRALRRLATQLVQDEALADDLVQDTWVDALRNPPREEGPKGPWLRTVLRNRRITNFRTAERRAHRERAASPPASPPAADQLQLARELLEHMTELPEDDRELLTLRYWEALSLEECAQRLGLSASTVRSRHARALTKLRARLDQRAGGREAWLAALAPWASLGETVKPTAPATMSLASLSVGGVLASMCLWLVSSLDPGCGMEANTASPEVAAAEAEPRVANAADPTPTATPTRRAARPTRPASAVRAELQGAKHPCERPYDPEDLPSVAHLLAKGEESLSEQELGEVFIACLRRHGPRTEVAVPENDEGLADPGSTALVAMGYIGPALRLCYSDPEPAVARLSFSFFVQENADMNVEKVKLEYSRGLDEDEKACALDAVSEADPHLRPGDVGLYGFAKGTVLELPFIVEYELANEAHKSVAGGRRVMSRPQPQDDDAFYEALQVCTEDPVVAVFEWDPQSRELVDAVVEGAADDATGDCVRSLLLEQIKPVKQRFFPETAQDSRRRCTFEDGAVECDPVFWYREPRP